MAALRAEPATEAAAPPPARWAPVTFAGDDHALLRAFTRGDRGAAAALFDRYAPLVERTIARILGADSELADAVQEAFIRMMRSAHSIRDPQALPEWVIRVAVCTAVDTLRSRRRRRWLTFGPTESVEPDGAEPDLEGREALKATYAVLDQLSAEDRAVFALRIIEGMELRQVAAACDCSLATVKRRLGRAEARFAILARKQPALGNWLAGQAGGHPQTPGGERGRER
jgi:RNA polymerase sigma-70 factor (ECF subfamily)